MKDKIISHKKGFTVLVCIMLIFFGCCSFPAYNLTKEFPLSISGMNLVVVCAAYYYIGGLQGVLFNYKGIGKTIVISLGMTLVGFGCRYLLEYGEVSNTYNFTVQNVILHLFLAIGITALASIFSSRNK